jgi:hypothetical protein
MFACAQLHPTATVWRADCTFIIRKIKTLFAQLFAEFAQNQAIFESANFFGLTQNFTELRKTLRTAPRKLLQVLSFKF